MRTIEKIVVLVESPPLRSAAISFGPRRAGYGCGYGYGKPAKGVASEHVKLRVGLRWMLLIIVDNYCGSSCQAGRAAFFSGRACREPRFQGFDDSERA